ncbi:unnamed protein product [Rhodiola kirilowii]
MDQGAFIDGTRTEYGAQIIAVMATVMLSYSVIFLFMM